MPPKKSAEPTAPFDFTSLREAKHYIWREIERSNEKPPLRVKLLDLNIREAEAIPAGTRTPLKDSLQVVYRYVVEWDLEAENLQTGKTVAVPAPGSPEATALVGEGNEWQLLEVIDDLAASNIVMWLKNPSWMELKTKNSKASESTEGSSDAESTTSEPKSRRSRGN
jgi:hypothetical protein